MRGRGWRRRPRPSFTREAEPDADTLSNALAAAGAAATGHGATRSKPSRAHTASRKTTVFIAAAVSFAVVAVTALVVARMFQAGKGHVVVSPLDPTSGLLGTNTWGIAGYEPGPAENDL